MDATIEDCIVVNEGSSEEDIMAAMSEDSVSIESVISCGEPASSEALGIPPRVSSGSELAQIECFRPE